MNTYVISVNENVIAMYKVYGKNKKEAKKYFFENSSKMYKSMVGYQKEIKSIICIEKVKDSKLQNVVTCNNANEA